LFKTKTPRQRAQIQKFHALLHYGTALQWSEWGGQAALLQEVTRIQTLLHHYSIILWDIISTYQMTLRLKSAHKKGWGEQKWCANRGLSKTCEYNMNALFP
jgi:hypothetical protein